MQNSVVPSGDLATLFGQDARFVPEAGQSIDSATQTAIENLSATYPIARLVVTEQTTAPDGTTQSQVRVIFVDEEGRQRGEDIETSLPGELRVSLNSRIQVSGRGMSMAMTVAPSCSSVSTGPTSELAPSKAKCWPDRSWLAGFCTNARSV